MTKLSFSFKLVGLVKDAVFHMGKAMLETVAPKLLLSMKIVILCFFHFLIGFSAFFRNFFLFPDLAKCGNFEK